MKINDKIYSNQELRGWIRDLKEVGYNSNQIDDKVRELLFRKEVNESINDREVLSLLAPSILFTGIFGLLGGVCSTLLSMGAFYKGDADLGLKGLILGLSASAGAIAVNRYLTNFWPELSYSDMEKIAKTAENNRCHREHGHSKRGIREFKLDNL